MSDPDERSDIRGGVGVVPALAEPVIGRAFARPVGSSGQRDLFCRHCERSEAIHLSSCRAMDCFAALAMTVDIVSHSRLPEKQISSQSVEWARRSRALLHPTPLSRSPCFFGGGLGCGL